MAAHILTDGRVLCYRIFGPSPQTSDAIPTVFHFHGSPGTQEEAAPLYNAAQRRDIALRVVGVTRPGFGGSTYQPGRTLLDFASDVLDLADALGIERFAVLGAAGGGPYALACVHALPAARLAGIVTVGSMYPPDLGFAGVLRVNRVFLALCPRVPAVLAYWVEWFVGRLARRDAGAYERFMINTFDSTRAPQDYIVARATTDPDRQFMEALILSTRGGFQQGSRAFVDDFALFGSPWGFDLAGLNQDGKCKVFIWHGVEDVNIPVQLAGRTASAIASATLRAIEGEAWLGVPAHQMDGILDDLLTLF